MITRREAAHSGQLFDERKFAAERDVLSENDQTPFAVIGHYLALRIKQKAAVEVIGFFTAIGPHSGFGVIAAEDEPNLVASDQIGNGGVDLLVESKHIRHGCLRPDEQVHMIGGKGLLGESD